MGAKFRRQHTVGHFIIDFYCHEARLAIEVDGDNHAEEYQAAYDTLRTAELESLGVRVLRFSNNEVLNNTEGVIDAILDRPHPGPLPEGEGADVNPLVSASPKSHADDDYMIYNSGVMRKICKKNTKQLTCVGRKNKGLSAAMSVSLVNH
jgi:hypothetical protein